jgi:hypothetical protein
MTMKAVLILLALVAGCQKGDEKRRSPPARDEVGRPASLGPERMATIDAMVRFVGGLRKTIEANQGDCARLADALAADVARGQGSLDEARALEKELAGDKAALDWIQGYVERKTGGFDPILEGLDRCSGDPAVRKSLGGFLQ